MTVSSELCEVRRSWTGAETSISTGFTAGNAASVAVQSDVSGVLTPLTRGTHYTTSLSPSGEMLLTPLNLPDTPATLVIVRVTPAIQPMDLSNGTAIDNDALEIELDENARRDAELRATAARTVTVPVGDAAVALPTAASRAGMLLAFDGDGVPVAVPPASGGGGPITASQIIDSSAEGRAILTGTLAEIEDVLSPVFIRSRYPEAYGANAGSGTSSAIAAILAAAADHNGRIEGKPGSTYLIDTPMSALTGNLPDNLLWDLRGATVKIAVAGPSAPFYRLSSFGTAWAVTSQFAGSISIVTSSVAADINPGDTVRFATDAMGGRWPVQMRRVVARNASGGGSEIVLDAPIAFTFAGNVTVAKVNFAGDAFGFIDGVLDYSACGAGMEGGMNIAGYRRMMMRDLRVIAPVATLIHSNALFHGSFFQQADFHSIKIENWVTRGADIPNGITAGGGTLSIYNSEALTVDDWYSTGDSFGLAGINCTSQNYTRLRLHGRYGYATNNSVRGLRPIGAQHLVIDDMLAVSIGDAVKVEDCGNTKITKLQTVGGQSAVNVSHQNPDLAWGNTIVEGVSTKATATPIGDIGTVAKNRIYSNLILEGSTGHGMNLGGENIHLDNITIVGWGQNSNPIVLSTLSGVVPTGSANNIKCVGVVGYNNYGIQVPKEASGFLLGNQIACNIGAAGGFSQRPPIRDGEIVVGHAHVNLNSTADQPLIMALPAGASRYRFTKALVYNESAVSAAAAVGGVYTDTGKSGTQVIPNTQAYTALTAQHTNVNCGFTSSGVQLSDDLSLYFSLSTASGTAATGLVLIYAAPISPYSFYP